MNKNVSVVKECVSCKTCKLVCPVEAITYKLNKRGFYVPRIDKEKCIKCGKCLKVCPAIKSLQHHDISVLPVLTSNNKDLNTSTSGAVFPIIAKYILENKGTIYGASFDEKFNVKHIRIDNEKDLINLKGSKYVLSDLNNIFLKVKEDLDKKKMVLFSGVPCQISALKSFLIKDYENLYTVDLICHGSPSDYLWKKYLIQLKKEYNSDIVNVEFRNKNLGWTNPHTIITFANGKKIDTTVYDNPYCQAFLRCMILSDGCYDCKYTRFRQLSDFTLGDYWGYPNNDNYNGITNMIINTLKGKKVYELIKNKLIELPNVDLNETINCNYPLIHSGLAHYNYKNYNINKENIIGEILYNLSELNGLKEDKNGVAILNFYYENYNYGANLVAYSLSEIIRRIGYNPYIINFDPFDDLKPIERYRTIGFIKFRNKYLNMTPRFRNKEDLKVLNKYFNKFVVGSDQVWRKVITGSNMYAYFFDFVDFDKSIISYAASFGKNEFEGTEEESKSIKLLLKKFNSISVRENDGKKILKDKFNINSVVTIDPTILLTVKDYEKIYEENNKKGYVAVYCLFDEEICNSIHLKELFNNKEILNIKGYNEKFPFGTVFKYNSIGKWLSGIKNSDFVITDSYHGVLFSLLYNKEFICIGNASASYSRFKSIIENISYDISRRMFYSIDEITDLSKLDKLNYEKINKRIWKLRTNAIYWLKNAFNTEKNITNECFDALVKVDKFSGELITKEQEVRELSDELITKEQKVSELSIRINELSNSILNLSSKNNELSDRLNDITSEYEKMKKMYDDTNVELNEVIKQNSELNDKINRIINSKSWKVTAPIRNFNTRIRGKK